MATALALIESAMSKINMLAAGETVSAEDASVGILRLNTLMDAWEGENLFSYATTDTIFTLPASTTSRTIGPSLQINVARPVKICPGSFSRIGGIDYPLDSVTEAEYNAISLKSSIGSVAPSICFYDGGNPTGIVYFWPTASTSAEVHLITPQTGTVALDVTTSFIFPPGYQRMIEYNLAVELAPDFNTMPSPLVSAMAMGTKRKVKRMNARVPQLDLPQLAGGRGNSPSDFIGGYYS